MKELFPGYFKPTQEDVDRIWLEARFVMDASVLLNIYRYSPDGRDVLLNTLEHLGDRLWVPYHAANEFNKNRLNVIQGMEKTYSDVNDAFRRFGEKLRDDLRKSAKHPFIDVQSLIQEIDDFSKKVEAQLDKLKEKHPSLLDGDPFQEKLAVILAGRVGRKYEEGETKEALKSAQDRIEKNIPPGYEDKNKADPIGAIGDYLVWVQIIEMAKSENSSVIFVTDDLKEDWWWRVSGKTLGPRPELVNEFSETTGKDFLMYRCDQFLDRARNYFGLQVSNDIVEEAENMAVSREEERLRHQGLSFSDTFQMKMSLNHLNAQILRGESEFQEISDRIKRVSEDIDVYMEMEIEGGDVTHDIHRLEKEVERLKEKRLELAIQVNYLNAKRVQIEQKLWELQGFDPSD